MKSPLKQRKRFAKFAKQLKAGIPPTDEQNNWLIDVFAALSNPNRETDRVLGLKYSPGHSLADEIAASKMDVIMHWISGATSSDTSHLIDPNEAIPALGIEEAIDKASKLAELLFGNDPDAKRYNFAYIKKCWYDKGKQYRQNLHRNSESLDVFYEFPID